MPIERLSDSCFAHFSISTICDAGMPRDPTVRVVPHGQFANEIGPSGSEGISPSISS
ncbi:hypothetical protein D3C83_273090 [compost metagenome]